MQTAKIRRKKEINIIGSVELVAKAAKGSRFTREFTPAQGRVITSLMECFSITRDEAILFSVIFMLNMEDDTVSLREIASFLRCPVIRVLSKRDAIAGLEKRMLIRRSNPPARLSNCAFAHFNYYIPLRTIESINQGKRPDEPGDAPETLVALLSLFNGLLSDKGEGLLSDTEFEMAVMELMRSSGHLGLVEYMLNSKMTGPEILLFLNICHKSLFDDPEVNFHRALEEMFSQEMVRFSIRMSVLRKHSTLTRLGLVKLESSPFASDKYIMLTESALEWLYGEDWDLLQRERQQAGLINHAAIPEKRLFFRDHESSRMEELAKMLKPSNFRKITQRMKAEGLGAGMTVLLHGKPGTGKTESVYQLARRSGRDIMAVDLSASKSMWYGESEKITKRIFDQYRKTLEYCKIAPILLFNEADGLFGKRGELGSSAVDQTANTIQNIILQEMETFEGILIATTNLTCNFDKAFERRFLYKILLDEPTPEARQSIWRSKLPGLDATVTGELAARFAMTGGQIDNIARKFVMKRVTDGRDASLEELKCWCREEKLEKDVRRVGY